VAAVRPGRLFIDVPFVLITHHQLSLFLSSSRAVTPCPQSLPRLPRIPTLPPFSTSLWTNTSVRPSKTSPSIHSDRSFPGFNPVIPPKLPSSSFESKLPSSINPRIATVDSRNGSDRTFTVGVTHADCESPVLIFRHPRRGCWSLWISGYFLMILSKSNIYLSGIHTSKHNFYGNRRSSSGPCLSRFPCTTYFNTLTLRRLKVSALAETSLSTSITASKDFFNGLRFTLELHQLRL
jgi:hypothetical protein